MTTTERAMAQCPAKPIIMSAESVNAILAGRKTQTRRVMKPQPYLDEIDGIPDSYVLVWKDYENDEIEMSGPHGTPGDHLWVREACRAEELPSGLDGVRYCADDAFIPIANTELASERWLDLNAYRGGHGKIVPPLYMPRWASRLTLEIVAVRVERLQEIDYRDVLREGIGDVYKAPEQLLPAFAHHWDRLNKARGFPWDSNPWVWVVTFRQVQP